MIGFLTAKGDLVRSILYPPPVDFKFEQDSYKFIGFLGLLSLVGFAYTIVSKVQTSSATFGDILVDALDLITIVVPPALPAAMTIGSIYAQKRLARRRIYCISPRTITVAGSLDCVCFDKTGTLTEDGMDLWGVVAAKEDGSGFREPLETPDKLPRVCHSCANPYNINMAQINNNLVSIKTSVMCPLFSGFSVPPRDVCVSLPDCY